MRVPPMRGVVTDAASARRCLPRRSVMLSVPALIIVVITRAYRLRRQCADRRQKRKTFSAILGFRVVARPEPCSRAPLDRILQRNCVPGGKRKKSKPGIGAAEAPARQAAVLKRQPVVAVTTRQRLPCYPINRDTADVAFRRGAANNRCQCGSALLV